MARGAYALRLVMPARAADGFRGKMGRAAGGSFPYVLNGRLLAAIPIIAGSAGVKRNVAFAAVGEEKKATNTTLE